ncbi:MAG: flavodoxin [Lachnospiraceae bacterium]|nr:flavodoxin [Lachnospiraceae bacterium]
MKRIQSVLLICALIFLLTAYSSGANPTQENSGQTTNPTQENSGQTTNPTQESSGQTANPSWENSEQIKKLSSRQGSISKSEVVSESENTEDGQSETNTLVVYFSRWGNTEYPDDVDATTSASIVVDDGERYGTTEYVANMIAKEVGGDLHRIETVTPYTADFDELRDVNHDEMNRDYLPELKTSELDMAAYDTVFVGYPVWAAGVPQAVMSFLNEYDLTGKTVVPFCTHDGYGAGNSYQTIAEASHAAVSLEGLAARAQDVPKAQDTIATWLTDIGVTETKHVNRNGYQDPDWQSHF